MIINTGNRTDIPAYFSEWFYNRIKEGSVCTRNPYYPDIVTRYRLSSDIVDCLVFCTKNPAPMIERLDEIKKFNQYWFVTITPYEKDIEPHVPQKEEVISSFKKLSRFVGIKSIGWRYDPIFITKKYSVDFHMKIFEEMCRSLEGYVDNCVISFIDLYEKTRRNFPQVREVKKEEQKVIVENFVRIGRQCGITIRTCCEGKEFEKMGADASGCITKEVIERAVGYSLNIPKSGKMPRSECNCLLGNDIGMYNTCGHGCLYCYANYDRKVVEQNMRLHNKNSPLLLGNLQKNDVVKEAKQESYIDGQMCLTL